MNKKCFGLNFYIRCKINNLICKSLVSFPKQTNKVKYQEQNQ